MNYRKCTQITREPNLAAFNASTTSPPSQMAMTIDELANELHISRNTAYALAQQKDFPSFRVGRRLLINRALLQKWMNDQCQPCTKAG